MQEVLLANPYGRRGLFAQTPNLSVVESVYVSSKNINMKGVYKNVLPIVIRSSSYNCATCKATLLNRL